MKPRVIGQRSPRWAFMQRFDIMDRTDRTDLYLRRWRLVQTPWASLYLHRIVRPDNDPYLHDHPWAFGTLILRGGYTEQVSFIPRVLNPAEFPQTIVERTWRRFSWHSLNRGQAHRIAVLRPNTWSLLLVGRRASSWGFYTSDGWVDWRVYEGTAS